MATTKSASKKPATKRRAAKAPVKRATTVRTKKAAAVNTWDLPSGGNYKSFKLGKENSFFSIRVTDQTIYWAILCFIVLALGVWVVTIDDKVQRIYDQIDKDNANNTVVVHPVKK